MIVVEQIANSDVRSVELIFVDDRGGWLDKKRRNRQHQKGGDLRGTRRG